MHREGYKRMLDINGNSIPNITSVIIKVLKSECTFIFLLKRIVVSILWRMNKKAEKKFDEEVWINYDKAFKKRLHGATPDCFMKARAIAEFYIGELGSNDFKKTVEYYFCYLTNLNKIFIKSWFKDLFARLFLVV